LNPPDHSQEPDHALRDSEPPADGRPIRPCTPMSAVFTCSIDDGHPSDLRAADLLARHGLNGTFYVPLHNCEGASVLDRAAIRELDQRFEVGSHTLGHCFLKHLSAQEARYQVIEGKTRLEDILGRRVQGFCYPGGKYLPEHAELVAHAGFRYARTTLNLCFDGGSKPFEMPTTFQFYPHGRDVYLRNFLSGGGWGRRREALAIALRHADWLDRLYALFDHCVARQGVFHLWGHSQDIDRLDAWDEFGRFLAYVAQRIPSHNRLSNDELAGRVYLVETAAPLAI